MRKAIAFGAIPAVLLGLAQVGVAQAATAPVQDIALKTISYKGVTSATAYGFNANDSGSMTAYVPIWYVSGVLNKAGISSTWNGTSWSLHVPNTFQVNLSNIPYSSTSAYNNTTLQLNGQAVVRLHSIAYRDPMGDVLTTYVPIWYLEQALKRIGLKSDWNGTTWTITSTQSFTNVDLRYNAPGNISTSSIDQFLKNQGSPLYGLGQSYMEAQNLYGVDANYLVSHSILETGWGKSPIALAKNNLFGYGAYDSNPGSDAGLFPSNDYAIRFEAWVVRQNYLNPGASLYVSPTLTGMNVNYATDPSWASSIGQIMAQVASSVGSSVANYVQYQGNNAPAPTPQANAEPVFYLNSAQATIQSNSYYQGVPYYPNMGTGMKDMFFGSLQVGASGEGVVQIQQYLNQQIQAGLTVDGQFGPMTQAAVENFQRQNGLQVNGVWDFSMWQLIHPSGSNILPASTSVNVDEIMQGMAGNYVDAWYHIPNYGWVDSQYVKFNNVYRVAVPNPTSTQTNVNVYSPANPTQVIASLHNGDFVVASSNTAVNGSYTIQFANEQTGQLLTGVLNQSDASLTQQN